MIMMMTTMTLWNAFLSKKLTVVHIARKLAALYVPRRTFGIFTAAILWPQTNPVEPKLRRHPCFTKSLLMFFELNFCTNFKSLHLPKINGNL